MSINEHEQRRTRIDVLWDMLTREMDVYRAELAERDARQQASAERDKPASVATHDGSAVPDGAPVLACVDEPPSVSA